MRVSILGFGCGAVGVLMVRGEPPSRSRPLDAGANYFDTTAQYGSGKSEENLGRLLEKLKPASAIVGTKVGLPSSDLIRIADAVSRSLEGSLRRLGLERVDIFRLHNAITITGGGEQLSSRQ